MPHLTWLGNQPALSIAFALATLVGIWFATLLNK